MLAYKVGQFFKKKKNAQLLSTMQNPKK